MTPSAAPQPLDWRRVGALSSTFTLHGLALALALLAVAGPRIVPEILRIQPDALQVDWVEPAPIEAPPPPVKVEPLPTPTPPVPRVVQQPTADPVPVAEPIDYTTAIDATPATPTPVTTTDNTLIAPPSTPVEAAVAYAHAPPPEYPMAARTRRQEGETLLRVLVGRDGRAETVGIERTSGHALLDRAALQAVRGWRFHPYRVDGVARPASIVVPVRFSLERG